MPEFDIGNLNLEADILPPSKDWAGHLGMGVRTEEDDMTAHLDLDDLAQHTFLKQVEAVRAGRLVDSEAANVLKDSEGAVSGAIANVMDELGFMAIIREMDKLVPKDTPRNLMKYPKSVRKD